MIMEAVDPSSTRFFMALPANLLSTYEAYSIANVMNQDDILIVDDDKDIVEAISTILMMHDYAVRTAYSGMQCIAEVAKKKPGLILLDLMLPDMNGRQVALALIEKYNLINVPIVILSAARDAHATAEEVGAKACIEKPFSMKFLLDTVKQYLADHQ